MANIITFEWIIQELDEDGEPTNSTLADSYEDAVETSANWQALTRIVLMRTVTDPRNLDRIIDRQWAEVQDFGVVEGLPDNFTCGDNADGSPITGARVPKEYHDEVAAAFSGEEE